MNKECPMAKIIDAKGNQSKLTVTEITDTLVVCENDVMYSLLSGERIGVYQEKSHYYTLVNADVISAFADAHGGTWSRD